MKIKKFEKYTIDFDGDDLGTEYSKLIISTYLDKKDDSTLESVYAEIVKEHNIEEEHEYIIKNTLQDYLYNLYDDATRIRKIVEIEAKKYNI